MKSMKQKPLDEMEEDFWQLLVAFSTGDRDRFKTQFRSRIFDIVMRIRGKDVFVPEDVYSVGLIDDAIELPQNEIPVVIDPVVEQPIVDDPIVDYPVIEQPIVDEPIVEKPIIENPIIEQPIVEEPTIEQPKEETS